MLYKQVTVLSSRIPGGIYAYVVAGQGKMAGAIYSSRHGIPYQPLCYSAVVDSHPGWNLLPLNCSSINVGFYFIALELNGSANVSFYPYGSDKFQYGNFNKWPFPANPVNVVGDLSLYATFCP